MPSNITFSSGSDKIIGDFVPVLRSVALVLKEYNRTLVNVYGHTDSDGSAESNQKLSQRRSVTVAEFMVSEGTDSRRYHVVGYGEERPVAENTTPDGKAQNRRVEIELAPIKQG